MLEELRDQLIAEGEAALAAEPEVIRFTGNQEADELLNDLAGHPHAFVFAALVDRQVRAERAWTLPLLIKLRLGSFEIGDLQSLSEEDWISLLRNPVAAHRMPETMARVLHRASDRILSQYAGDASQIWTGSPPSARVVRRILEFHGAGPKIATMAANILVRSFHIPLGDYRYIDISADVQVDRVMSRLGFVKSGFSPDVVIYTARELNPDFPGIFDLALWNLGRTCVAQQSRSVQLAA
jgi:endonuclease III